MIRLECFIDDKNVAAVMHATAGLVREPVYLPVANAELKNGKVRSAGELIDLYLQTTADLPVPIGAVQAFMKAHGKPPSAANALMAKGIKLGVIKATGKGRARRYERVAIADRKVK